MCLIVGFLQKMIHKITSQKLSVVKPEPKQLQWPNTTNVNNRTNQWEREAKTSNRRQARENACDQVAFGFAFVSDWLRRWREFFKPITEHSKANSKQYLDYFRHSISFVNFVAATGHTNSNWFELVWICASGRSDKMTQIFTIADAVHTRWQPRSQGRGREDERPWERGWLGDRLQRPVA